MKENDIYIDVLFSKIHRATLTDSNINYQGSISIDTNLMEKAKLIEGMKVDVLNINNGARFSTYVIPSEKNSGEICINGAAARMVQKGDIVIIIAYANISLDKAKKLKPTIVFVDENNSIIEGTK